jgi:hypothetical protein
MKARSTSVVLCALALMVPAGAARADTKVVTFDDLPAGTIVAGQYRAADGVRFDGPVDFGFQPVIRSAPMQAHSGGQVADIATCQSDCGEYIFHPGTRGRLDTTASSISMYVGFLGTDVRTARLVLTARDPAGNPVGSQDAIVTEGAPFTTKLEVASASANIQSFDLTAPDGGDESEPVAFDDLAIVYPDTPSPPDIALAPGTGVLDVLQGNSIDDPLQLSRVNGSNGDVTFGVSGLPTGMSASFTPNPVTGTDTATTMTLTAADGAAASTDYSELTVTATPVASAGPAARSITALTRISQNCDRTLRFQYVDARGAGCLRRQGHQHVAINADVRVNGLILKPLDGDRVLTIDDQAKTIKSTNSTYAVAVDTNPDIPFYYGPIDWDFSGTATGNHKVLGLDVSGVNFLKGIPITGLSVEFTPAGVAILKPTLSLDFWPFNYFQALTATTTLKTDNDHGPNFAGLDIKLDRIAALGIELKNVELHWQEGDNWQGSAQLVLSFAHKYEIDAGFGIKNGGFDYLRGSVSGLNVAVGTGIFLQQIGFEVHRAPLSLRGTVGFSGGPSVAGVSAITVNGGFTAVLADPFVVQVDGSAKVADRFTLASAFLRYSSTGLFEFGGSVNWDFKIVYVNGSVMGWVDGLHAFNVEGSVEGCIRIKYLPDPCASAKALLSSVGIAGCLTAYGYGVGAAATWSGDFDAFTGCDLGPWRATHSSVRAARTPTDYTLPAGLPLAAWEVQGAGDPPGVTLTGPNGEAVAVSKDVPYVQNDRFVAGLGEDGTSFVFVKNPAAGTWRLSDDGTVAVTRVRSARGLPRPSASARVRGRGHARTISWTVKPIGGQRVRFAEIGKDVRHVIADTKTRRGSVHFRPADGPAGTRQIVALVQQDGHPRATLAAGSYRAPGTLRPGRPTRLRIARHGSRLTISWRPRTRGFRVAVYLKVGDGRRLLRIVPASRRSVTVRGIARTLGAAVTVQGLTAANAKGPAARASIKPRRR